jgi:hypothetical protein
MAVYSKTLSDDEILALIPMASKKRILIVTCGGCVNESLAYDNDIPIFVCDKNGNNIPHASYVEAVRIADLLKRNGYEASIKLQDGELPVICIFSAEENGILKVETTPDIILTLSCLSGAILLRTLTQIPVYAITKQVGYLAYTYTTDKNGNRVIIKERSQIEEIKV